jgi:hypothetical protein
MFYKQTLAAVVLALDVNNVVACEHPEAKGEAHILWMCHQIAYLERTASNSLKAARWIGWILKAVEDIESLGWTNRISRDLVRRDIEEGNDVPK